MSILQSLSRWNHRRLERRKQARLDRRTPPYSAWVKRFDTLTPEQAAAVREKWHERGPLISVIMPTYNPRLAHLEAAIRSVQRQLYSRWELCIADDASTHEAVRELIQSFAAQDARIRFVFRTQNGHIAAASNSALDIARGDFVALLDQDDVLADHALAAVAKAIEAHPTAGLIYSDEDKIDDHGHRFSPHFKPDWNEFLLRSQNYIGRFTVIRRHYLKVCGRFNAALDGACDYDLVLRCTELIDSKDIIHIPHILYHQRQLNEKHAPGEVDSELNALKAHLSRKKISAEVSLYDSIYRVKYTMPSPAPRVSLIILTRDRPELLEKCVRSLIQETDYENIEVIIVDNGTVNKEALCTMRSFSSDERVKVIRDDSPFNFSDLNNKAAEIATGQYLCLVNNDIEVLDPQWLRELVAIGAQPGVGAVGARLYYPDGLLQHAGVVLGIEGIAGHAFRRQRKHDPHYMRLVQSIRGVAAVTGACLLTPKEVYWHVQGLNSEHLAVAYNDIDYCLKLRKCDLQVVYDPHAEFIHHESVSRGREDTPEKKARLRREQNHMIEKWGHILAHDPAYNPNLTTRSTNYSLSDEPRANLINAV